MLAPNEIARSAKARDGRTVKLLRDCRVIVGAVAGSDELREDCQVHLVGQGLRGEA